MTGNAQERVLSIESKYIEFESHIADIFAFFCLVVHGKSVLIKPNLLFHTEPEQGLNTHPAIVGAVIAECERQGAARVMVGDNAGQVMYGNSRQAFMESPGFGDRLGEYYVNLGLDLIPHEFPPLKITLYVPKLLMEVDVVINLPKMKTHLTVGISGAVKNTFGYIPGGQKAKMHMLANDFELFGQVIAGVHALRPPDLNITDCILAMHGGGPFSNNLIYLNCVLASTNALASDCAMCEIMGMKPEDVPHLRSAREIGIGTMNGFELIGKLPQAPNFIRSPGFDDLTPQREIFLSTSLRRDGSRVVPRVSKESCTKCGQCVSLCPTGTLSADAEGFPAMTGTPCASCHACQEVCENKAVFLDVPDDFSSASHTTWEGPTLIS
jgi:uncharacterized protein (DUF362 family)/Pyruvate/2-oxoacid:ferredoxin oxidoreductase delta subunit